MTPIGVVPATDPLWIWFEESAESLNEVRQPPYEEDRLPDTPHSEHLTDALDKAAKQAVSETDKERV